MWRNNTGDAEILDWGAFFCCFNIVISTLETRSDFPRKEKEEKRRKLRRRKLKRKNFFH